MRTIFEFLHDARKIGAGRRVHGSYVIWVCLQGRRAAAKLIEKDFSGHPVVKHYVLNNIHMHICTFKKDVWVKEKKALVVRGQV